MHLLITTGWELYYCIFLRDATKLYCRVWLIVGSLSLQTQYVCSPSQVVTWSSQVQYDG